MCQINKGVPATRARFVKQYHQKDISWVSTQQSVEYQDQLVWKCWENTQQSAEKIFQLFDFRVQYWADDKQSKARNSDSKYRQMALVGFGT